MKIKKLICAALAGIMVLGMSTVAFAAPGITTEEQAILTEAKAKAAELGVSESSAEFKKYYSQAETFLTSNEVTADQAKELVAAVDTAAATAKAEMTAQGVSTLKELKTAKADVFVALESKVAEQVKSATEAVGVSISVDAKGVISANVNGKTAVDAGKVVEQTGFDMTATVVVAAVFVSAIVACLVVASKKKFAEEAYEFLSET